MATLISYAQAAAKGRPNATTPQTSSSKVNSGTATPSTGLLSDSRSSSNWADDVEASTVEKAAEPQQVRQDESKDNQVKENVVDYGKVEDDAVPDVLSTASSDTPASSSSTTKDDDSSSAPNTTSSETTSESKSQTSEPAWIAERSQRQSSSQSSDKTVKGEKKSKESNPSAPAKPLMLQEAAPPPVNPWTKRAEEAKAKLSAAPKSVVPAVSSESANKENQRPRADSRRKANSVTSFPQETVTNTADEAKKPNISHGKPKKLPATPWQTAKLDGEDGRSDSPSTGLVRGLPSERQSLPNLSTAPPPVKDSTSWPTPESVSSELRANADKLAGEKRDEEATPSAKRKKDEWTRYAVTPNIIWETSAMLEQKSRKAGGGTNGERGSRGGSVRGRGGYRSTPSGGDRQGPQTTSSPIDQDASTRSTISGRPNSADRDTVADPAMTVRASSTGANREPCFDATRETASTVENGLSRVSTDKALSDLTNGAIYAPEETKSKQTSTSPRKASPKKVDTAFASTKDDEYVPAPIPRRSSIGTQTEEPSPTGDNSIRESLLIRKVPSENRSQPLNAGSVRDTNHNDISASTSRGNKRNGRGRGGNGRNLANGHANGLNVYTNGFTPDYAPPAAYGLSPSPSYQTRGNHQFTYPQPARGGWANRGNPRSQSIPIEPHYNNRYAAYGTAVPQVPSIHAYVPGMYDTYGIPMTALPYSTQTEPQILVDMVSVQLRHYFSFDNLLRDVFLRKHMDSQGFVTLELVANFNRVRQITLDRDIIVLACINSPEIQIRVGEDGKERLRRAEGWQTFVLPMDQREASAQNAGPEQLHRPERPQLSWSNIPPQFRGPASAGLPSTHHQRHDRWSYDSSYQMKNGVTSHFVPHGGMSEAMYSEPVMGEELRGRAARSPIHESVMSPIDRQLTNGSAEADIEPDAFSDERTNTLSLVVKMSQPPNQQQPRPVFHTLASRTFSNGSIDSHNVMAEMDKPAESLAQPQTNGTPVVNGSDPLPHLVRFPTPNKSRSANRTPVNQDLQLFWDKDHDTPAEKLPEEFTEEPYQHILLKARDQREHAATGTCPYDLAVLYDFWCHFLLRNFNNKMYSEFKSLANDDARQRHNFTGLQQLLRFYERALKRNNPIRDRVVRDYVELVKNEPPKLESAAFKQLRSAWRDGALNLKNRKKLADVMDEPLKERLDRLEP